jgi:predicted ATPase
MIMSSGNARQQALASYALTPNGDERRKSMATTVQLSGSMVNTSDRSSISSVGGTSSTQHLADIVAAAAQSSRKRRKSATNIAQLRLSNMNLHGREGDIKLLRGKLHDLAKNAEIEDNNNRTAENVSKMGESRRRQRDTLTSSPIKHADKSNNNLILVSGISGTGKSALIHKGLGEPASKLGYTFAAGKFDSKLRCPLLAFSDAMTRLTRCIVGHNTGKLRLSATLIQNKIQNEFDEEDIEQLKRVLPGCAPLLDRTVRRGISVPLMREKRSASSASLGSAQRRLELVAGKESISRIHYAIRRLLKIICSHLKGVILFIDDLQWSDTATLDFLKSIVLDGEIPSLMIVGAYREDEVPE